VVIIINDNMLDVLRKDICSQMSEKRYKHTLGVEKAAKYMSDIFLPQEKNELCTAALLHDITKEYSFEKQLKICNEFGIILRDDEKDVPEVLHGITAPVIISRFYPDYASDRVLSAVRWHTTGYADMTLFDKIICLADYIEDGREYVECIKVREFLKSNIDSECSFLKKLELLDIALLKSLKNTKEHLEKIGKIVNKDTVKAVEWLTNS